MPTKYFNNRKQRLTIKSIFTKLKELKSDSDVNKTIKVLDESGKSIKIIKNESN